MLPELYPQRLLKGSEFSELQAALDSAVVELRVALDDFGKQLNVSTATFGLDSWERALGLPVDVSKLDTERRERIMSKLRGSGTVTAAMIANVAKSFAGGEVSVIEDAANSRFVLKFSGQFGIPPNMADVGAAIDEIRPAHLAYSYEYSYLLIKDIDGLMKLKTLETQKLNKFAGGA
ncbi:MAG: putative phage tail protein [Oscillospiraceae bacterium]